MSIYKAQSSTHPLCVFTFLQMKEEPLWLLVTSSLWDTCPYMALRFFNVLVRDNVTRSNCSWDSGFTHNAMSWCSIVLYQCYFWVNIAFKTSFHFHCSRCFQCASVIKDYERTLHLCLSVSLVTSRLTNYPQYTQWFLNLHPGWKSNDWTICLLQLTHRERQNHHLSRCRPGFCHLFCLHATSCALIVFPELRHISFQVNKWLI